jgi:cation transporter-like permease
MVISSFGGKILNKTVADFPEIAAYQPVINGVAGNLVSVQASRISTSLHQQKSRLEEEIKVGRLLLAMVIPGHLIFNWAIMVSGSSEAEQAGGKFIVSFLIPPTILNDFLLHHLFHF